MAVRYSLAFGTALSLAACVSGERVTLLPHSDGGPVGSVAVLQEGGEETVLDAANQQARLSTRTPRVRQLDEVDPAYNELIGSLPRAASGLPLTGFPTGEMSLSAEQIDQIRTLLADLNDRPGYQIIIRGYTDSEGSKQLNQQVSDERARGVAAIVREAGFEIADEDIIGMNEYAAESANGDEVADANFRRVEVIIR